VIKNICCFICVTLLWALHIVIKQQFFYIYNYITLVKLPLDEFSSSSSQSDSEKLSRRLSVYMSLRRILHSVNDK